MCCGDIGDADGGLPRIEDTQSALLRGSANMILMRGKGSSVDHFHPRSCSGNSSARRRPGKRKLDDVVVIDVDNDSLQHELQGNSPRKRDKTCALDDVISIDDDESNVINHSRAGMEGGGDLESDATSSKTSCPATEHSPWDTVESDDDECQIIGEKRSYFKVSNHGGISDGVASCSNRYGLHSEPGSDPSDSDCSDCEIVEDSYGKLREQWENASRRRRNQCGLDDQGSASCSPSDTYQKSEEGKKSMQRSEANVFSSSSNSSGEKENLTAFAETYDGHSGAACLNPEVETHLDTRYKYDEVHMSGVNSGSPVASATCRKHNSLFKNEKSSEEQLPSKAQQHRYNDELGGSTSNCAEEHSPDKDSTNTGEIHVSDMKSSPDTPFSEKNGSVDEQAALPRRQHTIKTSGNSVGEFSQHTLFGSIPSFGKSEFSSSGTCQGNERSVEQRSCLEKVNESVTNAASIGQQHDDGDRFHAQNRVGMAHVQADAIINREKLKETDEYRRAMEEEWASRQEQLRIQAEEAQRLRKKRRAESMRVLEMERRQKQRVEEIRDTQKKDEEKMNLKEQLRVQVRKELDELEMRCSDMASLLRGLGIQVGGGFCPLSHEVHAAYKRALLKFHPDRASRTDIRQQVEAEEKFKLISRMKEKFLSAY